MDKKTILKALKKSILNYSKYKKDVERLSVIVMIFGDTTGKKILINISQAKQVAQNIKYLKKEITGIMRNIAD